MIERHDRQIQEMQDFRERFRTRAYMSSSLLLPDQARGKPSYGYDDALARASYRDFEDIFRGDEEFVKSRLREYDSFFQPGWHVLEIGCGRGEFLELLAEKGVQYVGVDVDLSMIRRCHEKGLSPVIQEDFETYLKSAGAAKFEGIFSAQLIEHIPSEKVPEFFKLCHAALKPGGVLAVETVNPYSIEAMRTFYVDLTHQRILYQEVLLFCCIAAGFSRAAIFYPNHGGFTEATFDVAGEYAVIAYK